MNTKEHQYSPVWISKVPAVAMIVVAACILGTGALVRSAVAKDAVEQLPQIHGVVAVFEGDTLTIGTTEENKKTEKKFTAIP